MASNGEPEVFEEADAVMQPDLLHPSRSMLQQVMFIGVDSLASITNSI